MSAHALCDTCGVGPRVYNYREIESEELLARSPRYFLPRVVDQLNVAIWLSFTPGTHQKHCV